MFKEMRNNKRQVSESESLAILETGEYGVFSTVGDNGYPYGVPVSYVLIDRSIYFHCATEGAKLNNIRNNNKVSFSVVGNTEVIPHKFTTKYESVIVFGTAEEVSDKDEKEKVLMAIAEKYSKDFLKEGRSYIERAVDQTSIVKINIEHISGKANR
jgi:uncharacterized protein